MQIRVSPAGFSDWPQLVGLVRASFAYMDSRIDPPSSLKRMGIEEFKAKAIEETLIVADDDDDVFVATLGTDESRLVSVVKAFGKSQLSGVPNRALRVWASRTKGHAAEPSYRVSSGSKEILFEKALRI